MSVAFASASTRRLRLNRLNIDRLPFPVELGVVHSVRLQERRPRVLLEQIDPPNIAAAYPSDLWRLSRRA